MTVVGLLPLISLLFICLTIRRWRSASKDPDPGLYALLSGTTVWAVLLAAVTEALSLVGRLTFPHLLAFWTVAALVSAALYGAARRKYLPGPRPARAPYSFGQVLLLAAILAITATIGCI